MCETKFCENRKKPLNSRRVWIILIFFIVTSNFKNSMYPRNFEKSVRKQYENPDSHHFYFFFFTRRMKKSFYFYFFLNFRQKRSIFFSLLDWGKKRNASFIFSYTCDKKKSASFFNFIFFFIFFKSKHLLLFPFIVVAN